MATSETVLCLWCCKNFVFIQKFHNVGVNYVFTQFTWDRGKRNRSIIASLGTVSLLVWWDVFAFFQSLGMVQESIEDWKMMVRIGAISLANSLKTRGDIPSGPVALLGLRFLSNFSTPSVETIISGIEGIFLETRSGNADMSSSVKTDLNCAL